MHTCMYNYVCVYIYIYIYICHVECASCIFDNVTQYYPML